jgi:hypothetical protein
LKKRPGNIDYITLEIDAEGVIFNVEEEKKFFITLGVTE